MTILRLCLAVLLTCLATLTAPGPAAAQSFEDLVADLPEGKFAERSAVVARLAALGDPRAVPVLEVLRDGNLHVLKSNGAVVAIREIAGDDVAYDAITGAEYGIVPRRGATKIRVNNGLRRDIRAAIGTLTLRAPDPALRLAAAEAAFSAPDPDQLDLLRAAREAENTGTVAEALDYAIAATLIAADAPEAEQVAAIEVLREMGNQDALSILTPLLQATNPVLAQAAAEAVAAIEANQRFWNMAQNVWFGLSLGSVLLLAAIGLAITFGVMGVINMAHGELVMIGAYTTFFVQEIIRTSFPHLFDWSLLIAAPLAFLIAGAVGVAIERGCVRFLYGRPLETLLATWGISLILQQTVRSIFGPNNREVGNPSWMSGAFEVGQMTITYNRLWILLFALAVFAVLLFVLKKTAIGLQMRAVTQNRAMAANMGIRTGWVDAMTFGLGAGIAGLAGVALSQIDNVSPNLGQSYIVDSFMVVVFGGAGNIWGTLAAAFSLGIANKFLEPYAGAVLAKILVLVFIILFIQKRPRGLFAVKGRAVEN
ncbi:urea ABC transporter permease subunit UrtB [Dinoroseobacter sp. PD6]|uniref:urea ABC transporter permease subunit UrtB n=1 Tax=Dinoroseobacter sp. PD6 TaxID=3028384 RepID=UPI00237AFB95|nr:urea ABC transporter permease subunit UrtB [Dinoroseobacter sp. PD6]MDD9717608.1 urea ABC transporter permease subunit UrtB [Dinoroseobacter sp. PD6]